MPMRLRGGSCLKGRQILLQSSRVVATKLSCHNAHSKNTARSLAIAPMLEERGQLFEHHACRGCVNVIAVQGVPSCLKKSLSPGKETLPLAEPALHFHARSDVFGRQVPQRRYAPGWLSEGPQAPGRSCVQGSCQPSGTSRYPPPQWYTGPATAPGTGEAAGRGCSGAGELCLGAACAC